MVVDKEYRVSGVKFRLAVRSFLALAMLAASTRLVSAQERGERPPRIVSMAPSITEILFAVGAGDRVVGVTEFCAYPPEARERPACGGYFNPNYELIVELQPDLIVLQGRHEQLREFAERQGLPLLSVEVEGIDGILHDIETIGERVGEPENAAALVAAMRADLAALRADLPPVEERPSVFLSLNRLPGDIGTLFSTGAGSFLDEMLTLAGGRNVLGDVETLYPQIAVESLVARDPDTILELLPGRAMTPDERAGFLADWRPLGAMRAVAAGRVELLTDGALLIPGPRLVRSIVALRRALYPGRPLPALPSVPADATGGGDS